MKKNYQTKTAAAATAVEAVMPDAGRVFATRAEARRAIFTWINWYNGSRLHSTLNDVAPLEWERQYRQAS